MKSINRSIAGRLSRNRGYSGEDKEIKNLQNNTSRTINICKSFLSEQDIKNIRKCNIKNISAFKTSNIKNNNEFKNICTNYNIEYCDPPHDKTPCDIILFFTYMEKPYIVKYDIKNSKSTSTQLCSKELPILLDKFDIKDSDNIKKYIIYHNKKRTWIELKEKEEIKNNIIKFFNIIKNKWILDRWCPELYHNEYIMKNNIMINIKKFINKELTFSLVKTNIICMLDGIKFISIKPHGSRHNNRIQLHIYKDIFNHKDAIDINTE